MRKTNTEFLTTLLGFLGLGIAISNPVWGYIDPGSGSYFAQMVIASAASFFLFVLKPLLKDLKQLFKRPSKKEETSPNQNADAK